MIEAVIFDMDGLLIDSEPYWQKTEKLVLGKYGIDITPEMQRNTFGLRTDEQIEYWYLCKPWPDPDFQKDSLEFDNIMEKIFRNEAHLMEGVEYILQFFRKKKITMALASSSKMNLINAFTERFRLKEYFSILHSAEFEEYGKPHPAVYISTAKKLGVNPGFCLAFEDSFNGLLAAKSARMKVVIVPDHRTSDNGKYDIADLNISALTEFGEKEYQLLMNF